MYYFSGLVLTLFQLYFLLHVHLPFTSADSFPISYSPTATTNCVCNLEIPTCYTPKLLKLVIVFGVKNFIATCLVILLTLLNVIVYKLRELEEQNFGDQKSLLESSSLHKRCRRFSFDEIQLATRRFDDDLVLGRGGFGKVYKGVIVDHETNSSRTVAVKRLKSKSKQGACEFWTEIKMLSQFRHSHLVSLIGYCNDLHEMILVYEYMPQGSLADHLHKISTKKPLPWEKRLKICIGAARGLDYLHTGTGVQKRVIHRDVKSSNILLDENLEAKISDFGLSKIGPANQSCSYVSTKVRGTHGYFDPEYVLSRRLTRKSDVYAFGVVLFEVLCGRPALDLGLDHDQQALALLAKHRIKEGTVDEMVDISLSNEISQDCRNAFVEIAHGCLHTLASKRPTMAEVVAKLEFSMTLQQSRESFTLSDTLIATSGDDTREQAKSNELINEDNDLPICAARGTIAKSGAWTLPRTKMKTKILQAFAKVTKGNIPNIDSSTSGNTGPSLVWYKRKLFTRTRRLPFHDPLPTNAHICTFSVDEIRTATKNFHEHLKVAHYGNAQVFKGYMQSRHEEEVAIKRLNLNRDSKGLTYYNERACRIFFEEIKMLSKTNHQNIVSLVGYCYHKDESCLLYKYVSKGPLSNYIYSNNSSHILPWKRRIEICIGVARGLRYLNTGVANLTVPYRNIGPTAILLDENWTPKIYLQCDSTRFADFRADFSSDTFISLHPKGYRANFFSDTAFISLHDRDVRSMGMLLLEVLVAVVKRKHYVIVDVLAEVINSINNFTFHEIIDPCLVGKIAPECLVEFIDIAFNCFGTAGLSMGDVVKRIEYALQLQEGAELAAINQFDGDGNGEISAGDGFKLDSIYPQLLDCINTSKITDSVPNYDFDSMEFNR